jgi:hypothetical protein
MTASEIARNVDNRIQSACYEMASEINDPVYASDPDLKKKIKEAKKLGVTDVSGWLADEYYNDEDLLADFVADWASDLAGWRTELYWETLEVMKKSSHTALKNAVERLELSKGF